MGRLTVRTLLPKRGDLAQSSLTEVDTGVSFRRSPSESKNHIQFSHSKEIQCSHVFSGARLLSKYTHF